MESTPSWTKDLSMTSKFIADCVRLLLERAWSWSWTVQKWFVRFLCVCWCDGLGATGLLGDEQEDPFELVLRGGFFFRSQSSIRRASFNWQSMVLFLADAVVVNKLDWDVRASSRTVKFVHNSIRQWHPSSLRSDEFKLQRSVVIDLTLRSKTKISLFFNVVSFLPPFFLP